MPVHLFGRPAPLEDLSRPRTAADRGRRAGVRRAGDCDDRRRFDVQLLPDEEPRWHRGRRPGHGAGGRARRARAAAAVPRIARQARLLLPFGTNSRLDELQAAALRLFLERLDEWNALRRDAAARYAELGLGDLVELPADDGAHVYHLYVVRTPERDRIAAHWPQPRSGARRTTPRRSTSSRRSATSGGGRLPAGNRARGAGEPRAADVGGDGRRDTGASRRHCSRGRLRGSDRVVINRHRHLAARSRTRGSSSPRGTSPSACASTSRGSRRTTRTSSGGRCRSSSSSSWRSSFSSASTTAGGATCPRGTCGRPCAASPSPASSPASSCTSSPPSSRSACRARSRSWTGCCCSRSSPARGCSPGRSSSGRRRRASWRAARR